MTLDEALEAVRGVVQRIELDMMADGIGPAELERLRAERANALRDLRLAEEREAERRERERRQRPSAAELWQEWQGIKFLRRSKMTPAMMAALIARFGAENYRKLPW
jgi:hypothetical protein